MGRTLRIFAVATLLVASISIDLAGAADNRVLIIGIDGAGGSFLEDAETPNIDVLIEGGAASYRFLNEGALVANPPAGYGASGVNWSTILTGASAAHHGVTDNSFAGNRYDQFPHFFKYIHDSAPERYTASIVNWAPINDLILNGPFADLELQYPQDSAVASATVELLNHGDPDAIFLHFDQVDAVGHSIGWGTQQYYTAIENVDGLIGTIMAALNARPGVVVGEEDWLVLITSDHGGQGTGHNAAQGLINWEVPFVISGDTVPAGTQLPVGSLRDVVPTALWHLGIDPFAFDLDGSIRGLPVGPLNGILADINQDGVVSGDGTGPIDSDDVTAFVAGWLTHGPSSMSERFARGDLNLDGITDLADWAILQRENSALAGAVWQRIAAVPEPAGSAALLLWVLGPALASCRHGRK